MNLKKLTTLAAAALLVTLALGSCASGPKAYDFSKGPLVDELVDFSMMAAYDEEFLRVDDANAAVFEGDNSRVARTADIDASVLYNVKGASKVTVVGWFWQAEEITDFTFLAGKDRYELAPVTPVRQYTPPAGMNWHKVNYVFSGLPEGTIFLKVVFSHVSPSNYWNPQIGKVILE
jgi:hypothetical protein